MGDVRLLVACGLTREATLLARPGMVAVPGGGDAARLEAALEDQLALLPNISMVLSCGIAGALDPALRVGDVVVDLGTKPLRLGEAAGNGGVQPGASPVDGRHAKPTADSEQPAGIASLFPYAQRGAIIGQDHIAATAAEKALLYAATGALAVDMESHVAARVAARHDLPFAAIRIISDTAQDTLPPAALVGMNPDGSMALGRVLLSLARHPGQLPALIRTGRSAGAAFGALRRVGDALVGVGVSGLDLG